MKKTRRIKKTFEINEDSFTVTYVGQLLNYVNAMPGNTAILADEKGNLWEIRKLNKDSEGVKKNAN